MNFIRSRFLCLGPFALFTAVAHAQVINSFDTLPLITKPITTYVLAKGELTSSLGVVSGSALKLKFPKSSKGQYPTVSVANHLGHSAANKGGIALTVTNIGTADVTFTVTLVDKSGSKYQAPATIASGATETLRIDAGGGEADPMAYGMQMLPNPFAAMRTLKGFGQLNLEKLATVQLYQRGPSEGGTVVVDDLEILPDVDYRKYLKDIVDDLGQNAKVTYPGKTTGAAALVTNRIEERADLDENPSVPGRGPYGGDANGPSFSATGFFRTKNVKGKWWLVTPDGKPFWSVGFCTATSSNPTIIQGRKYMFDNLPAGSRFYGTADYVHKGPEPTGATTFDYFAYNLSRKYGSDYEAGFVTTTLDRASSWGFNTIGGFSDEEFKNNGKVPYCGSFGIEGSYARISTGNDYWQALPDPFDPAFKTSVDTSVQRAHVGRTKNDPYLIGWFVDNEMTWTGVGTNGPTYQYALVYSVARLGWDSPAKRNFVRGLVAKYSKIEKLNDAWGTSFGAWSDLYTPVELSTSPNEALTNDMSNFMLGFMRKYFVTIRNSLRAVDPNHMYMGCRFSKNDSTAWYTPETLQAASEYCSVVSMNYYSSVLKPEDWTFLNDYNAPFIIGEFQFGTTDRGMFNPGIVPVSSTADRGAAYQAYLESAARIPSIVGAHWFQYADQPLLGRPLDGQNVNFGLIDIADQPYPEMVAAARAANAQVYAWHKE